MNYFSAAMSLYRIIYNTCCYGPLPILYKLPSAFPSETAKGKRLAPRPGEVAKRSDAVRREAAGKAYAEDISPRSTFEFLL